MCVCFLVEKGWEICWQDPGDMRTPWLVDFCLHWCKKSSGLQETLHHPVSSSSACTWSKGSTCRCFQPALTGFGHLGAAVKAPHSTLQSAGRCSHHSAAMFLLSINSAQHDEIFRLCLWQQSCCVVLFQVWQASASSCSGGVSVCWRLQVSRSHLNNVGCDKSCSAS